MAPPRTPRARTRTQTTAAYIAPSSSEPDLSKPPSENSYSLRGAHKRALTAYTNSVNKAGPKHPPPTKPVSRRNVRPKVKCDYVYEVKLHYRT